VGIAAGGRILIHLLLQGGEDDSIGGGSSQEVISNHCGIGRTHVHRALKPLIVDGLIREERGRLPGHSRKIKVYSLTDEGIGEANRYMESARVIRIRWRDENGGDRNDTVFDAAREMSDVLGASGLPLIPVPLLLSTDEGSLSWSEILWLANSLRKTAPDERISVEGWSLLRPPAPPDDFLDRETEVRKLSETLESGRVVVVQGERGSGKRTLADRYSRSRGLMTVWIGRSETGEDAEMDPGGVDLIVMIDPVGPDPLSMLLDGSEGYPKILLDDLPTEIRELPVIVIREWIEEDNDRGNITLGGLSDDIFIRSCMEMGMDRDLSGSLHRATKGSPAALSFIRRLGKDELQRILDSDIEDAILGVMLGMNDEMERVNTDSSQKID